MADEYKYISELETETPAGDPILLNTPESTFLAISDGSIGGGGSTSKLSVKNLLGGPDKLLNIRNIGDDVSSNNKLFGTHQNGVDNGVYGPISIGQGLLLTDSSLSAKTATSSTLGVASFSDTYFTVSDGLVSIKPDGVSGTNIASKAVSCSKIQDIDGYSVIGRSVTGTGVSAPIIATTDKHFLRLSGGTLGFGGITTSDLPSTTSPSGGKVALTDANGYLNSLVKETVYIQLVPLSEPVTTGIKLRFWVPTHLQNKTISAVGCGLYSAGSAFTISVGGTLLLSPSGGAGRTDAVASKSTGTTFLDIEIGGTPGTAKGLDFWFVIG